MDPETKTNPQRLLLVDDDTELCAMLEEYLEPEGFEVVSVNDGLAGLANARKGNFDLIILDIMLPNLNGLEVLRILRSEFKTPVIMLTARGEDVDRIVGLEVGADDYLPKPFNPRELVARARAILRRAVSSAQAAAETPTVLEVGSIALNGGTHKVHVSGDLISVTGTEFRVLEVLMRDAGQVISREQLTEKALGRKLTPYDRSIDTHISNLRKKLGADTMAATPIRNVRGAGYVLALPDQEPDA